MYCLLTGKYKCNICDIMIQLASQEVNFKQWKCSEASSCRCHLDQTRKKGVKVKKLKGQHRTFKKQLAWSKSRQIKTASALLVGETGSQSLPCQERMISFVWGYVVRVSLRLIPQVGKKHYFKLHCHQEPNKQWHFAFLCH
ncbi:hypothetical protein DR999_PMT06982 [Platysternon megacephalum]|uniref:Uncharacterized protein n=1 Tax=Platysternon megacephalum TaxID=55544 RepID=A0A4D9EEW5_9SAUR|nr:hypothetical protein DR999_PMT06982 [Platysternon megacephalum]